MRVIILAASRGEFRTTFAFKREKKSLPKFFVFVCKRGMTKLTWKKALPSI